MKLERDKIEVLDANVPYSYIYNLSTPYQFKLLRTGRTDVMKSDYFSFCIDGKERSTSTIKRIAIPNNSDTAKIAVLINWSDCIGQNIQVDKIPGTGFYLFTKWNDDWTRGVEILGCILDSNEDICDKTHPILSGFTGITFSKENSNNDCLVVFQTNENQAYYYNPVRDISRLSAYCKECGVLRERFFTGAPTTEHDAILADVFMRTKNEIEQLRNLLLTRSELRAGSRDLSKYVTYSPENEDAIVLIGTITDNDNESGQVIKCKNSSEPEVITNEVTKSLFTLLGNKRLNADEIAFVCTVTNDGAVEIKGLEGIDKQFPRCKTPDETLRKSFQESEFLRSYCNEHFNNQDELFVYIAFEGIKFGAKGFDSYFFAISNDLEATKGASEEMYYAFRYILYLKSENENYANEQKRRRATSSAIAAIMSRNMSHNLGSHYLYYTKKDLQKHILNPQLLRSDSIRTTKEIIDFLTSGVESDVLGASLTCGFMQDRMNYLAAILESEKYPSIAVNYKAIIETNLFCDENVEKKPENFYLGNLVRSEGYSKRDGTLSFRTESKVDLEQLNLSLPGGAISVHAFYNILENFIRNSAKYQWGKPKPQKLRFYLKFDAINVREDYITCTFIDNKKNADIRQDNKSLLEYMNEKLRGLKFLDENEVLNHHDKGLKEMLISAIWLQINRHTGTLSDLLYEFDNAAEKISFLDRFGIRFASVKLENVLEPCLGIKFRIPVHRYRDDYNEVKDFYGSHADILTIDGKERVSEICKHYPRLIDRGELSNINTGNSGLDTNVREVLTQNNDFFDTYALHIALKQRGIDEQMYQLMITPESGADIYQEYITHKILPNKRILFSHHLSNGNNIEIETIKHFYDYAYVDSISGSNYTKTICHQVLDALVPNNNDFLIPKTWKDKYRNILIKESALTRITIIDERLFNGIEQWLDVKNLKSAYIKNSQLEYDLRNIRILNYYEKESDMPADVKEAYDKGLLHKPSDNLFVYGNDFRDVLSNTPDKSVDSHFLSIHLGIIDKILNNPEFLKDVQDSDERAQRLMNMLRETFAPNNPASLYICIHSGRGNINTESSDVLKKYPLVPFSALQTMFHNSKFLLCQMLYNIKY